MFLCGIRPDRWGVLDMTDAAPSLARFPLHDLAVEPGGRWLESGGRPTFLLADTCWAAFQRPTDEEWTGYLRHRQRQGFNGVLVSMLPIAHDRSIGPDDHWPFVLRPDGMPDRDALDPAYFDRARRRCEEALAAGVVPIVVVLWCAWVADTWAAKLAPGLDLSEGQLDRYVDALLAAIGDLPVVLCVSGDDKFRDPVAVDRYVRVLDRIHAARPERLTTIHTSPDHDFPARLIDHPALSIYGYQSSHTHEAPHEAHRLAAAYRARPTRRPVIDLEPTYEGIRAFNAPGSLRHHAFAARHAAWTSVLGGAGAGVGYGAHGTWQWHRPGDRFTSPICGEPFPHEVALDLPGAWDFGLIRRVVEGYGLFDLTAADDLLAGEAFGARVGRDDAAGHIAVYRPDAEEVRLAVGLAGWAAQGWDLATRDPVGVTWSVADGVTTVGRPDGLGDTLVVFSR